MLKEIQVTDFRNLGNIHLKCGEGVHVLLGENGQGKTNFLEAIYALSIGKPFRCKTNYEAICFDKEAFHIKAETS